MKHSSELLKVFVYGTLKRGFLNHESYCQGALSIEPAVIRGRLYVHSFGYPVVEIPSEDVLAEGTASPLADMGTQIQYMTRFASSRRPSKGLRPDAIWGLVSGELMSFDDPQSRLTALDDLEAYTPHEPTLYRRVLILSQTTQKTAVPAWAYVLGTPDEDLKQLTGSVWPSPLPTLPIERR